jgi:hypothetical protein
MTVNEARIQMMLDELKKFAKSMRADLKMLSTAERSSNEEAQHEI